MSWAAEVHSASCCEAWRHASPARIKTIRNLGHLHDLRLGGHGPGQQENATTRKSKTSLRRATVCRAPKISNCHPKCPGRQKFSPKYRQGDGFDQTITLSQLPKYPRWSQHITRLDSPKYHSTMLIPRPSCQRNLPPLKSPNPRQTKAQRSVIRG